MSSGFGIGVWNVLTSKVVRAFIITLHNKNMLFTVNTIP